MEAIMWAGIIGGGIAVGLYVLYLIALWLFARGGDWL